MECLAQVDQSFPAPFSRRSLTASPPGLTALPVSLDVKPGVPRGYTSRAKGLNATWQMSIPNSECNLNNCTSAAKRSSIKCYREVNKTVYPLRVDAGMTGRNSLLGNCAAVQLVKIQLGKCWYVYITLGSGRVVINQGPKCKCRFLIADERPKSTTSVAV